jgi:hypothetical protein
MPSVKSKSNSLSPDKTDKISADFLCDLYGHPFAQSYVQIKRTRVAKNI